MQKRDVVFVCRCRRHQCAACSKSHYRRGQLWSGSRCGPSPRSSLYLHFLWDKEEGTCCPSPFKENFKPPQSDIWMFPALFHPKWNQNFNQFQFSFFFFYSFFVSFPSLPVPQIELPGYFFLIHIRTFNSQAVSGTLSNASSNIALKQRCSGLMNIY